MKPLVSWQLEQPILFFINYVNVNDVMSLGQMLLALIIYCCHYGSRFKTRQKLVLLRIIYSVIEKIRP